MKTGRTLLLILANVFSLSPIEAYSLTFRDPLNIGKIRSCQLLQLMASEGLYNASPIGMLIKYFIQYVHDNTRAHI